jgi:serine/threonine protein kinase
MRDSVRLADFGYSTLLRSQSFRENYNVGTPIYMSP